VDRNVQRFKDYFDNNIWRPIDAILELRENILPVDLVVLSHLNSIPEFIARCQGFRGKDRKKLRYRSSNEYLYVQGIRQLITLDPDSQREIEKAKFLYKHIRCGIAHFITAKNTIILSTTPSLKLDDNEYNLQVQIGWMTKAENNKPPSKCELVRVMIYVPSFYEQIKEGVRRYIQNVEEGKCTLKWQ